jgi:prolyl-tRNA synthetase
VTLVHRVDRTEETVPLEGLAARLPELLDASQRAIFERARARLDDRSVDVSSIEELVAAFAERPVFATAPMCNTAECETAIKNAVHALTVRVLRADRPATGAPCIACGTPSDSNALLARSY